jgi:D-alanyl-D-alanine carboxypeptidase/D-alanyl-D-alanine-endopeptidase (penicillin-binding protein 4)
VELSFSSISIRPQSSNPTIFDSNLTKFMRYLTQSLSVAAACVTLTSVFPLSSASADTAISFENGLNSMEVPLPRINNTENNSGICSSNITTAINKIIDRPELNQGKWAILVQSLGGTNIYSLNPDSYMVPASNMKLLVTAAALQEFNPDNQINSTSISDWIKVMNLNSDNAYANALLNYVGGSQSVQKALANLGIDTNGYRMRDGAGLSHNNLATPRTLVSILKAMYHGRGHEVFLASLPVAGISGTLKHRLQQTTTQGTVRAKTGTLRGVKALSGYLDHPEYGTLVFSIITNQPIESPSNPVAQGIDDIVVELSKLSSCS